MKVTDNNNNTTEPNKDKLVLNGKEKTNAKINNNKKNNGRKNKDKKKENSLLILESED